MGVRPPRAARWRGRTCGAPCGADDVWIRGRGGAFAGRRVRARPWPLPLPALATVRRRGHTFVDGASGRVCTLCQHPERSTRGSCPGAAGALARGAATQIRLDGSAEHRIVDLLQGGKVVSVLCAVCCSYCGPVVRQSLLSNCPGVLRLLETAGNARRAFGFPALVPNALQGWIVFLEKCCPPSLVHVAPGAQFFPDPSSFPFWQSHINVAVELVLNLPKLDLSVTVGVLQLERATSRDVARVVFPTSCPPAKKSLRMRSCQVSPPCGARFPRQRTTTALAATWR